MWEISNIQAKSKMEINIWKSVSMAKMYNFQIIILKSTERVFIYPYQWHMEVFVCWNIKNLDWRSVYISLNLLFNWYIQSEQKFIALSTICI